MILKKKVLLIIGIASFLVTTSYAAKKIFFHTIDQSLCNQCGNCVIACPENAIKVIKKDDKSFHEIDPALCTQCGICIDNCPLQAISAVEKKDAVKKAGDKPADKSEKASAKKK